MRACRLIVFGLIATGGGALIERPAAADIVIGDETTPVHAAVCLDVPLLSDLHLGVGLGVPEPCPRPLGDGTPPLQAAVCVDVPLVLDLQVDVALGVAEPCPRALDEGAAPPAPPAPLGPPAPEPAPKPATVPAPAPVVPSVAAPRAVDAAPVAAPPIVAPPEPSLTLSRRIGSDRPSAPTLPPNPFGSTVALVVIAAALAGGTNILFRSS